MSILANQSLFQELNKANDKLKQVTDWNHAGRIYLNMSERFQSECKEALTDAQEENIKLKKTIATIRAGIEADGLDYQALLLEFGKIYNREMSKSFKRIRESNLGKDKE